MRSKNLKLAWSFFKYCLKHPELRFWQSLRSWSGLSRIEATNGFSEYRDTFYWEEKNK